MDKQIIYAALGLFVLSNRKYGLTPKTKIYNVTESEIASFEAFERVYKTNLYEQYVTQVTKVYNVPAVIVKAIIYVESRGNPNAIGAIQEIGLMQITAGALSDFNKNFNENIKDLFNPFKNIQVGTGYLAILKKRFGGNWDDTIVSYNGGNPKSIAARENYLPKVKKAMRFFS